MLRASIHPYVLPLVAPVVLRGVEHATRRGALLRLEHGAEVGWGDCAPLPGFSRESIGEALSQLERLLPWVEGCRPAAEWGDPGHPIHEEIDELGLSPSVRFALDLALLDLAAHVTGRPLPMLLDPDPQLQVPLNALLTGEDTNKMLREAEASARRGYTAIKVKVGRRSVEQDVALVRDLRLRIGLDVALRCDANQAWTLTEAIDFAEGIFGLDVAYVEEPLREPADLGLLWARAGLPIALDESLADLGPEDLAAKAYASAAVLKPTLLGGMIRTMRYARAARAATVLPVISAAFESGVAMRGHVALASVTGAEPAGLDPYNRLAVDLVEPRLPLDRPSLDVRGMFARAHRVVPPRGPAPTQ